MIRWTAFFLDLGAWWAACAVEVLRRTLRGQNPPGDYEERA